MKRYEIRWKEDGVERKVIIDEIGYAQEFKKAVELSKTLTLVSFKQL
jgi:hypothetical protein